MWRDRFGRPVIRRVLVAALVAAFLVATVMVAPIGAVGGVGGVDAVDAGSATARPMVEGLTDTAAAGVGRLVGGATYELQVTGRGGVPAGGVDSVALNVTVTRPSSSAFVTVWPSGEPRPTASNLNVVRGQTVANLVVVRVGVGGRVSLYASGADATDVVVDVLGWFPTGGGFTGVTPARVADTRPDGVTVDGAFAGGGVVTGGVPVEIALAGRGGVPPSGDGSVALNVTVTSPTADAFLTVWPSGRPRPTASNANVTPGRTVPNLVIVPLGADGRISVFLNAGTAHVIVDVLGWFAPGASFTGLTPARLLDTRSGLPTIDGAFAGSGALIGGSTLDLTVVGRGGVPATGVAAVAVTVTAVAPTAAMFLTVWPTGVQRPTASNLNAPAGRTVANAVVVPVGAGGRVSLFVNAGEADVVVDVLGWFPPGGAFTGVVPARLLETRGESGYVPLVPAVAPWSMVFDGTNLWIGDRVNGLVRFDVAGESAERAVLPGFEFADDLVFDGEFVWMVRLDQVGRLDPRTGAFRVFGPWRGASGPSTPVRLGDHVWTMNRGSNSVSRIDRVTGAVRVFALPDRVAGGSGLTTDGRYLWFPSYLSNAFVRFDPATGAVRSFPLTTGMFTPISAVFDGRRVWTARRAYEPLPRVALSWVDVVDGTTGDVDLDPNLGHVTDLVFDGTHLWTAHDAATRVSAIDPATGAVTMHEVRRDHVDVLSAPLGWAQQLAVAGDVLWIASANGVSYLPTD